MAVEHEYVLNSEWKNSIDYKPIIYDLAEDLMYFCIFYPTLILINRFFDVGFGLYFRWFILFAAMIFMTINRRKSKKLYTFTLILFTIVTLVALIPSSLSIKVEMLSTVLISAIVSVKKLVNTMKRAEYRNDPSIEVSNIIFLDITVLIKGVCFLYLTYMVSLAIHANGMLYVCLASSALLFSCFGIYIHKTGTYSLIEWNKSRTYAIGKIKRFNLLFAFCSTAVVGVISFLAYSIVYFTGLSTIDDIIIGLFTVPKYISPTTKPHDTVISHLSNNTKMFDQVNQQPNILMQILGKVMTVFFWIIFAAIILMVLFMLIRLVFGFLKNFQYSINEESKTVFSIRETTNEIAEKIKKSRVIALFSGSSNSMKIRKLYYRLIKKYRTMGVQISNTDSPAEIGLKIENDGGRNIIGETLIYEKARYGFKDCEKNDVELLKSRLKQ